ncbi:transposase IS605 [Petrotoga mexicana DSM 14811]|uniref:Transposase IS605 n=4 Tax=Petrotoga TaxID=28236 RepID=A0A2K1PDM7_9BACT|nr:MULTISPECIES: RNA-guided endonuclease TnpB family protein [Petrotoga]ABX31481.1 transposase, IS605 OrfB family [Petrotoga mobilis SJ95]PNR99995.1 transposase IS605 [Petrotoga miotherma DSM 10691]PNS00904.1 transposase IS605 [Petrotoga mexicana DSM 14811]POZ92850.1 transposase [Petrotoga halophila DSM 16923]
MLKTYKFRIYPSNEQIEKLNQHFGHTRFVYNLFLEFSSNAYKNTKTSTNYYMWAKVLTVLKKTEKYQWLNDVNSQSLQQSIKDLETGYKRFFKKQAKHPKFKKKSSRQSFRVPQHIQLYENEGNDKYGTLFVPKFKEGIKVRVHRKIDPNAKIKNCTFIKTTTGKYFVSITFEVEGSFPDRDIDYENSIGMDMGLKDSVVLSDGTKYPAPKVLSKYERKLKHAYKKFSSKEQGSKNWDKAKLEVARIHEKIKNTREDFLHKLTKEISENQADVFVVETLNIRGMLKNHHLAKSISDSGWYQFKTFLKYKAERLGKKVIEIGMFEPSSKVCSVCGYKNEGLKLSDREWVCPECGTKHDRDVNAAVNIRQFGLKQAFSTQPYGT